MIVCFFWRYLGHPKIQMPSPWQLTVASFYALDWVGRVQSTPLTVDWICFINCHISTQKLGFITLKHGQTLLWIIEPLSFLVDCEHTRHPFSVELLHVQIWCTRSFDIFRVSVILLNFTLRSFKIILWIVLIFSGVTTSFERPLCCASSVSVRPSTTKSIFYIWLCWCRVRVTFIKPLLGLHRIFSNKKRAVMNQHTKSVFYPFFHNNKSCFTQNALYHEIIDRLPSNFDTTHFKDGWFESKNNWGETFQGLIINNNNIWILSSFDI